MIERILREHLRTGDRVAVEDPSFPGVIDLLSASGYAVVPFAVDEDVNLWVPVRDEGLVVRALAERGWAVAPGERFRIQAAPAIRVTISTLQPADADRFAGDLAEALRPATARFA